MTTTNITQADIDSGLHFTDGNRWSLTNITFSIPGAGATWDGYAQNNLTEPTRPEYATFSQVQADAFRAVVAVWDSYIAASITEVSDTLLGDLRVAFTDTDNGGTGSAAAYAYSPPRPGDGAHVVNGDIWVDNDFTTSQFEYGQYNRELLFHEVGHALGLKHPFEGATLPAAYENSAYTVMSYSRTDVVYTFTKTDHGYSTSGPWNVQATPMVLDIAAIQSLYGADTTTAAGNTVYAFTDATIVARQSIYDAGGIDTLDLTALSRGSTIDLRAGAYSDVGAYSIDQQVADAVERIGAWAENGIRTTLTNASYKAYTYTDNLGIAFSTVIENVIGSNRADDITGNDAANILDGRGGEDTLQGLGGNDIYVVDDADDVVIEAVGGGVDKVMAIAGFILGDGQEIEKLTTTNAAGTREIDLTGNDFAQTIQGNAGANTLDGMGGADTLQGFGGNDTYLVDDAGDRVFEAVGGGADTVIASVSYGLQAGQEVERLQTSDATATTSIKLAGSAFAQTLEGNAGANLLDGKGGADSLYGLAGNDTYVIDDAGDLVFEAVGGGADKVMASASYILAAGQEVEKLTTTDAAGTTTIDLTGNGFVQTIQGNAGNNILDGKGGADTLQGYGGNDTYLVDDAGDRVIETAGGGSDTIRTSISYALAPGQEIETLRALDAAATTAIKLTGNEFAQTLEGNAGANLLDGRGGADTLRGLAGNDTYVIDDAGDLVFEAVGGGADKVMASASYILAAGQEIEKLTTTDAAGTTAIALTGNAFVQTIQGNAGNNILDGRGGTDTLQGGGGRDSFAFSTALSDGNVARIIDFAHGVDTITLSTDIFRGIGLFVQDAQFKDVALGAVDHDDRILYDSRTGNLAYDADGNGQAAAATFATLTTKPINLAASDFGLFAVL